MLDFKGKVVVITGAAQGLGLSYARAFAKRGAQLLINDVHRENGEFVIFKVAKALAGEFGVEVEGDSHSVEQGEKIISHAVEKFGTLHVLVNNAGMLMDSSLAKMKPEQWESIVAVHLTGSFRCVFAAWPIFRKQGYGRIINTSSSSGLYGNFGQTNYSAAKAGLIGFTFAMAKEGGNSNILTNCIAPMAGTRMTKGIIPDEIFAKILPETCAPLIVALCHESCEENGAVFEAGGGYYAKVRWQRAKGIDLPQDHTPEQVLAKIKEASDFTKECDYPESGADTLERVVDAYQKHLSEPKL